MKPKQKRPGAVEMRLSTPWAFPPGISESGVGLREVLMGLILLALIAIIGGKGLRGAASVSKAAAATTAPAEGSASAGGPASAGDPASAGAWGTKTAPIPGWAIEAEGGIQ